MSSKDVPEPWASRMVEKNFTDPRYNDDRPSMSRLAEHIGAHTSTVSAAIHGTRRTRPEVAVALAEALGADVAGWLGMEYHGKWDPPATSSLLTDRQRKAIEELINSMTERQENDRGNTAPIAEPISQPGPGAEARTNASPDAAEESGSQDDYAKAAQAAGAKTKANRARRRAAKQEIPGEHQGEGPKGGA